MTRTSLLIFAAAFLSVTVLGLVKRRSFKRRFPPISDEEFLARCKPGTSPEVALKVRRIIAREFGVDYARVYPTTRFVNDLGA